MTTLLAATDLSDLARRAAERAALLASQMDARLELYHVVEGDLLDQLRQLMGLEAAPIEARLLDEARGDLAVLAELIGGNPVPAVAVGQGFPPVAIAERAEQIGADLVLLGARGAGFLRRALLGATAERLLRKGTRAMLVVRREADVPYRRVLLPVDLSAVSERAIAAALTYAPGAEIILFHAYEVPFEGKLRYAGVEEANVEHYRQLARQQAVTRLATLAEACGLANARRLVGQGAADTLVLEQADLQAPDLIVVGKHGRHVAEELLLGSVTKHVLAEANCDVLVIR